MGGTLTHASALCPRDYETLHLTTFILEVCDKWEVEYPAYDIIKLLYNLVVFT